MPIGASNQQGRPTRHCLVEENAITRHSNQTQAVLRRTSYSSSNRAHVRLAGSGEVLTNAGPTDHFLCARDTPSHLWHHIIPVEEISPCPILSWDPGRHAQVIRVKVVAKARKKKLRNIGKPLGSREKH